MCNTASDLLWAEELSALVLSNMVPQCLDEGPERLHKFGECRDKEGAGKYGTSPLTGTRDASPPEAPCKETMEEEIMDEGNEEENYKCHKKEWEDADDESKSSSSESM